MKKSTNPLLCNSPGYYFEPGSSSLVVFIAYWLMRAYMGKVLKIAYGLADDLFFDSQ